MLFPNTLGGCVYFIAFTLTSCAGLNKLSDLQTAIQYPIPPKDAVLFLFNQSLSNPLCLTLKQKMNI